MKKSSRLARRANPGTQLTAVLAITVLAASAFTGTTGSQARAQDQFPSRLVRIIVPYAAGGQIDIVGRLLANGLSRKWGQTVIVENIVGAGGNIGSAAAFRANPDGHTLLVTSPSFVTNEFVYKKTSWTSSQWSPVSVLVTTPYVLVARKDLKAPTVLDVIALARKKAKAISYASNGVGTSAHLSAIQLQILTDIEMLHVPYKGAAPALTDLIAGRVDVYFDALTTALPAWRDQKVSALGVTSPTRSRFASEIPALAESGAPKFESMSWVGLMAPPATPPAIVNKINDGVRDLLKDPETAKVVNSLEMDVVATTPDQTRDYLSSESARWKAIISKSGISLD